jgi:hypothetical protein
MYPSSLLYTGPVFLYADRLHQPPAEHRFQTDLSLHRFPACECVKSHEAPFD